MVIIITKENQNVCPDLVISRDKFEEEVFFPKIRNINRLQLEHKKIIDWSRTEKYDGQNIGCQKKGEYLIFYSRNGILTLQHLGKKLIDVWNKTDWNTVFNSLGEKDILYFEAIGNHPDFNYSDVFENGYGLMVFALRKDDGRVFDPSKIGSCGIMVVPVIEKSPLPNVENLRKMIETSKEGYVFTSYDEEGKYIAYKAKRRDLEEEVTEEEEEVILKNDDKPAVKIARIVCTPSKVKHIFQKLQDGEIQVKGMGIDESGKWDGSNAIIPTLAKIVQDDCWEESKDKILSLQGKLGKVNGREINNTIKDIVTRVYFDITLKSALA